MLDKLRGELLVAILKEKSDFAILQEQGWYRIPVDHRPKRWPPRWLAFYQPKAFGEDAYCVRYFGEVDDIRVVRRCELFPNEIASQKSERSYYRITLKSLEERRQPIPSLLPRRLVFIPTTWEKFDRAEQINDLFDDSPLEDRLWTELKRQQIRAERQWAVQVRRRYYQLDFALFCRDGQIDVETDGDQWHAQRERIPLDNRRNNDLESTGWRVLRFNGHQVRERATECIGQIEDMINRLKGLKDEGIAPRTFYPQAGAQQLSLFDETGGYQVGEAEPFEMD